MFRTFTSTDLVALPKMSAHAAIAVATQLLFVAATIQGLSPPIVAAMQKLRSRLRALKEAAAKQRALTGDEGRAVEADRDVDAAWRALAFFLDAYAALPQGVPEAERAAAVRSAVLPDGLKFTQLPYKIEWSESESRIAQIDGDGHAETIEALGGASFLSALRKAHADYGDAIGITEVHDVAPPPPLREPLDGLMEALRVVVVQVASSVRDDDPETAVIADRLLAPLTDWPTRQPKPTAPPPASASTEAVPPSSPA